MTKFDEDKFSGPQNIEFNKDGNKTNEPQKSSQISQNEVEAILELPAVFASKFYLSNQDDSIIRLVFVDEFSDKKYYKPRASIAMSINGFMSLAQLLYNTANNIQAQLNQKNHFQKMLEENAKRANQKPDREDLN